MNTSRTAAYALPVAMFFCGHCVNVVCRGDGPVIFGSGSGWKWRS